MIACIDRLGKHARQPAYCRFNRRKRLVARRKQPAQCAANVPIARHRQHGIARAHAQHWSILHVGVGGHCQRLHRHTVDQRLPVTKIHVNRAVFLRGHGYAHQLVQIAQHGVALIQQIIGWLPACRCRDDALAQFGNRARARVHIGNNVFRLTVDGIALLLQVAADVTKALHHRLRIGDHCLTSGRVARVYCKPLH